MPVVVFMGIDVLLLSTVYHLALIQLEIGRGLAVF